MRGQALVQSALPARRKNGSSGTVEERSQMLEFVNVHKHYGNVKALDGCSFNVAPGRVLGFLGPNGAGKTTAMRSVFGLVRPDEGSVRWMGHAVTAADHLRFGYMPEERGLYPRMRVHDQVTYFAEIHGLSGPDARRAADAWLERLGLTERAASRVDELSHGNQQRVQLAVALVHGGDLLVLDEPFAGLDPIGISTLGEVVRDEAKRGAAVVFSSHQLDLVENLCDDVAIIDRGRIVLNGSRYRYIQMAFEPRADSVDWASLVSGAEVIWKRAHEVRLLVPRDSDPGEVLLRARRAGEVQSFRFEPPSISDLFMEAVR
jgi:ABC-2 type transport system ATP-binding protein